MTKGKNILLLTTASVVGLYFLFLGLAKAQAFLVPFITAIILALLMIPLSNLMEKKISRGWASLISTFVILLVSIGFMALISLQVKNVMDDWDEIKQTMAPKIEQLKNFVYEHTPVKPEDLPSTAVSGGENQSNSASAEQSAEGEESQQNNTGQAANESKDNNNQTGNSSQDGQQGNGTEETPGAGMGETSDSGGSDLGSSIMSSSTAGRAASFFNAVIGFFTDFLLTFIYIFFLINYRRHYKRFFIKLFADDRKKDVKNVINKSAKVTQRYLVGKLLLIGFLTALYALGLGISGVNNFILVSALAALFSLVPYIGNIIGFLMAMTFGYLTSGETTVLIGIIITFSVAQFIESYILEPYIVGDQVDLHPFMVILAVIIGNMVWGVMGMVLAIPVLAILNVLMLNITALKPFGYLFSQEDSD